MRRTILKETCFGSSCAFWCHSSKFVTGGARTRSSTYASQYTPGLGPPGAHHRCYSDRMPAAFNKCLVSFFGVPWRLEAMEAADAGHLAFNSELYAPCWMPFGLFSGDGGVVEGSAYCETALASAVSSRLDMSDMRSAGCNTVRSGLSNQRCGVTTCCKRLDDLSRAAAEQSDKTVEGNDLSRGGTI